MKWLVALAVALPLLVVATSPDPRTLVLIDNHGIKQSHSTFFAGLEARGHRLTFSHVLEDTETRLEKYGEYFFDNVILFAPSAEDFGEHITGQDLIAFMDSGRNILIAGGRGNISEPIRAIANECGIDFDEEETMVIDHFSFDASADEGDHTVLASALFPSDAPAILGKKGPSAPVLFSGIGHAAATGARMLVKLLTASSTAYSGYPDEKVHDFPQSVGEDTLLVTALQSPNNGRVVVSGSLDMWSNRFFSLPVNVNGKKHAKSGNEEFCTEVGKWVFQERGVLRAREILHRQLPEGPANPQVYRIKDQVHFEVVIEEWSLAAKAWVPFTEGDVQLEFVMLDPYIRQTLKTDGKGLYYLDFTVPDVYGVYKFVINYVKKGYSNLEVAEVVTVRPFRHNEFERFIDVAFPYYTSVFASMAAFFVFGIVFLYSKDKEKTN